MILATAYDSKYPWGPNWKKSLEEQCNVPFEIIDMDSVSTKMPNNIIQHGEFLDYLKPGDASDVILFSDADCVMQRGFSKTELNLLDGLQFGDIAAQYNNGPFCTLAIEAVALGRTKAAIGQAFLGWFPGFQTMPVFCTGVVAARRDTWAIMRGWFERHWNKVDSIWYHYARIQWLMSYIMTRHLNPLIFTPSLTQQPLAGAVIGLTQDEGGKAYMEGQELCIRHAINLDPPKKGGHPKESEWPEEIPTYPG